MTDLCVQPLYYDFWDSSAVKAQEEIPALSVGPKISLAAGADTYPAGGPTFNLTPASEVEAALSSLPSLTTPTTSSKKYAGIVGDMLDGLGVPHNVLSVSPTANENADAKSRTHSRPLDAEEQRGVYVLLGLLFGSWAVGSIVAPSRKAESKAQKH